MSEELRGFMIKIATLPRPVFVVGSMVEHAKRLCVMCGLKRADVRLVSSVDEVCGVAGRTMVVLPGYGNVRRQYDAVLYWRSVAEVRELGIIFVSEGLFREIHDVDVRLPRCFGSAPGVQGRAENECESCDFRGGCLHE